MKQTDERGSEEMNTNKLIDAVLYYGLLALACGCTLFLCL